MAKESAKLKIGDKMEDGIIYAGISPDTGEKMYVTPADAPMRMDFDTAAEYAKTLKVGGKKGFRVPSKAEHKVLFCNREKGALKGTFNLAGGLASQYWSSTQASLGLAWRQHFSSDGNQCLTNIYRISYLSVRCVRG